LPRDYDPHFPCAIRFSGGSAENVPQICQFKIGFEAVSPDQPVTPDAWVTSNVLPVVHGRVTDANGEPVPGALVQIRERRRPGQTGIAASDVFTDPQGYYSYDRIDWPYTVGAIVYEPTPSGQGSRHQYQGRKRALEGSQQVDFSFGRFPVGTATLRGVATDPNGAPTKEFTVDARLRIGWDDESAEYRYTYGHREPFSHSDGRFEINGLAAGPYLVSIIPKAESDAGLIGSPRSYTCQLQPGQETAIGQRNTTEKTWYGRVLFEDGSPAVSESPDHRIQVVAWGQDNARGQAVATVDSDGYFAALMPDEQMQKLQSGQTRLKVTVVNSRPYFGPSSTEQGEAFPAELLSPQRDKAGTVTISRPHFYYGRILYTNGKPLVPPAAPWPGAEVYLRLRYTPSTSTSGGITRRLPGLDEEGYFTAYLTDEQFRQIIEGHTKIDILHPSYTWEWQSFPIGQFPSEMLSPERRTAGSYVPSFAQMSSEHKDLKQYLDSAYEMEALAAALREYADSHNQNYPGALQQLAPYTSRLVQWVESVEYVPPGLATMVPEPAETVLAYDRTLLEATGNTHVLFADGHLEFCQPRRLEILGIAAAEPPVAP
jgi:hypothetical protein